MVSPLQKRKLMGEINVVPYIDVMLVLLVIFMVTAPLLTQGIEVDLPKANSEPIKDESNHLPLVLSVDIAGNLYLNVGEKKEDPATAKQVIAKVSSILRNRPKTPILVKADKDVLDALYSGFPAGTLTGAPKIRAMEIIHELEPTRRGVYSGAIGYFDFTGDMNTCIAIRTMVMKNNIIHFQSGAGIVYDSNPEKEWEETINKAKAINSAINLAENGLVDA